jgi:hypothetical protein
MIQGPRYSQTPYKPNKLERYIPLACKDLSGTNTPAYLVHSLDMMKMKCCEYGPWKGPKLDEWLRAKALKDTGINLNV